MLFRNFESLLKYQVKRSKKVLMYSTKHRDRNLKNGKAAMISEYNRTKFAVDIFDAMVGRYAYNFPTKRWPVRIFQFMIDASAINAHILFGSKCSRRSFLNALSQQLMGPQKRHRAATRMKNYIFAKFWKIGELIDELHEKVKGNKSTTPSRCKKCKITTRQGKECEACPKDPSNPMLYCPNDCKERILCNDCLDKITATTSNEEMDTSELPRRMITRSQTPAK